MLVLLQDKMKKALKNLCESKNKHEIITFNLQKNTNYDLLGN